jgi:glutaredoxin-related protein
MRIAALALGLVVAAGACASRGTAAGEQSVTAGTTTRRTNVISAQEIRESAAPTVADLIRQARPSWPTAVTVFVNNDAFGGYDTLRNLSLSNTSEVRYLTRSEAQMKWGSRFQEVIQVITR